jgi:hypothetical protein
MANPYAQAASIAAPYTGIGNQIMQGANAYEMGKNKMQSEMAKQFAMQAHADLYGAQAGKAREEAMGLEQARMNRSPQGVNKMASVFAGLNEPQSREMQAYQSNGNWGVDKGYSLPADQEGPVTPDVQKSAPQWYSPQVQSKYNMGQLAGMANASATGKTDGVKLFEEMLNQGRIGDALAKNPQALNALQAAMKGEMFNATTRGVLSQETGQEAVNKDWQSAERALANQRNASASNSMASRDLTRSKIGQGETKTLVDGTVLTTGIPSGKEWKYDAGSDEFVAPPTPEFPNGRRSGNLAKLNAAKSLEYVLNQFDNDISGKPPVEGKTKSVMDATSQGGWLGLEGQIGRYTDTQLAKKFDNLREQLSTELRTIYRIPGEGALSDKEQAQYGIQLPDVKNSKELNNAIRNDLRARTSIRMDQSANPLEPRAQQQQNKQSANHSQDKTSLLRDAKEAIGKGADRAAVIKELKRLGVDGGSI